uniref:Uncharacterized protein n=1 Tax=Cucumis sativus TaxID=3659 RepID=A0A0A0LCL1_CUCSA
MAWGVGVVHLLGTRVSLRERGRKAELIEKRCNKICVRILPRRKSRPHISDTVTIIAISSGTYWYVRIQLVMNIVRCCSSQIPAYPWLGWVGSPKVQEGKCSNTWRMSLGKLRTGR